jgi:hypothetical protein
MPRAFPPLPSFAWYPGLTVLALLSLQWETAIAAPQSPAGLEDLCRPAVLAAGNDVRLPPGLLLAIARVESGRRDPTSGATVAWPWSINAEGVPMIFDTREAAVAAVEALRVQNVRLIDVGCMQVNLHHHPDAFSSIAEAFDPAANTRYAARFLKRLHNSAGDWETAIGRYHSTTPGLSERYRARVLAAWSGAPALPAPQLSQKDIQRERLAAAWADRRGAGGDPSPPATVAGARNVRDAVGQMAALWQRTLPGEANRPMPAPTPAIAQLAQRPTIPAGPAVPRASQLSARCGAARPGCPARDHPSRDDAERGFVANTGSGNAGS